MHSAYVNYFKRPFNMYLDSFKELNDFVVRQACTSLWWWEITRNRIKPKKTPQQTQQKYSKIQRFLMVTPTEAEQILFWRQNPVGRNMFAMKGKWNYLPHKTKIWPLINGNIFYFRSTCRKRNTFGFFIIVSLPVYYFWK